MTNRGAVRRVIHQKPNASAATMIAENETIRMSRNIRAAWLLPLQRLWKATEIKCQSNPTNVADIRLKSSASNRDLRDSGIFSTLIAMNALEMMDFLLFALALAGKQ